MISINEKLIYNVRDRGSEQVLIYFTSKNYFASNNSCNTNVMGQVNKTICYPVRSRVKIQFWEEVVAGIYRMRLVRKDDLHDETISE